MAKETWCFKFSAKTLRKIERELIASEIVAGATDGQFEQTSLLDEALSALSELLVLTEDTIDGNYDPDSATCDPAKAVFAKVDDEYRKEHNLYPYSEMDSMGNLADNIDRGR